MVLDDYYTLVEGLKVQPGALSSRGSSFVQNAYRWNMCCPLNCQLGLEVHYSRLGGSTVLIR